MTSRYFYSRSVRTQPPSCRLTEKTAGISVSGKGGGKPDSAMGGGSEVLKIDDALAIVDDFVAEKLGL